MQTLIWLVALVGGIWFMVSKKKNISAEQPSLEALTGKEKLLVFVLCLVNPILLGAIFYFGWKKKLPQQAKTANRLSFLAFGVFLIVVAYFTFSSMKTMSRDTKRHTDVSLLQTSLELYANDHKSYPETLNELQKPYNGKFYINDIPVAPTPADGPCTEDQNNYSYKQTSLINYEITYCMGLGEQLKNSFTGELITINPGVQTAKGSFH
jgi:preprotein translocase subunit YajC